MGKRSCSIDGCDSPAKGRGWCSAHYQRWYKYGDPLHIKITPRGEQFAYLVDSVKSRDRSECWIWPYGSWGGGYGQLMDPRTGRTVKAHRLAF